MVISVSAAVVLCGILRFFKDIFRFPGPYFFPFPRSFFAFGAGSSSYIAVMRSQRKSVSSPFSTGNMGVQPTQEEVVGVAPE